MNMYITKRQTKRQTRLYLIVYFVVLPLPYVSAHYLTRATDTCIIFIQYMHQKQLPEKKQNVLYVHDLCQKNYQ